jgi:uncharacterized surface protein with fasciclin (FAS1) repeats
MPRPSRLLGTLTLLAILPGLARAQDKAAPDLVDTAVAAGQFETLAKAAAAAGLLDALRSAGPLTVFAPTDEAFAALGEQTLASLLKPENRDRLAGILKHHVVAGRVDARTAVTAGRAETLAGTELTIRLEDGRLKVGDATVVRNDVSASNGIIHVIDRVLLPPVDEAVPDSPRAAAMNLIETAVERGAPRFNAGDARACAEIYDLTLIALIGLGGDLFDADWRDSLIRARTEAARETEARDTAWRLRRALDATYRALDTGESTEPRPNAEPARLRPRR